MSVDNKSLFISSKTIAKAKNLFSQARIVKNSNGVMDGAKVGDKSDANGNEPSQPANSSDEMSEEPGNEEMPNIFDRIFFQEISKTNDIIEPSPKRIRVYKDSDLDSPATSTSTDSPLASNSVAQATASTVICETEDKNSVDNNGSVELSLEDGNSNSPDSNSTQTVESQMALDNFRKEINNRAQTKLTAICDCKKKILELEKQIAIWKEKMNRCNQRHVQLRSEIRQMKKDTKSVEIQVGPSQISTSAISAPSCITETVKSNLNPMPNLTRCPNTTNVASFPSTTILKAPALQPSVGNQGANLVLQRGPAPLPQTPLAYSNANSTAILNQAPPNKTLTSSPGIARLIGNSGTVPLQRSQPQCPPAQQQVRPPATANIPHPVAKKSIVTVPFNGLRTTAGNGRPGSATNPIIVRTHNQPSVSTRNEIASQPQVVTVLSDGKIRFDKPPEVKTLGGRPGTTVAFSAMPTQNRAASNLEQAPSISSRTTHCGNSILVDQKPVLPLKNHDQPDYPALPSPPRSGLLNIPHINLPPKPDLIITQEGYNVTVGWDLPSSNVTIKTYHLYYYQHGTGVKNWTEIATIAPLPLPMACNVGRLASGHKHYFILVAEDVFGRFGTFSDVYTMLYQVK